MSVSSGDVVKDEVKWFTRGTPVAASEIVFIHPEEFRARSSRLCWTQPTAACNFPQSRLSKLLGSL